MTCKQYSNLTMDNEIIEILIDQYNVLYYLDMIGFNKGDKDAKKTKSIRTQLQSKENTDTGEVL